MNTNKHFQICTSTKDGLCLNNTLDEDFQNNSQTGVNVIVLKIVCLMILRKMAFLNKNKTNLRKKIDHNIGFEV
jgi:hypothetical protein